MPSVQPRIVPVRRGGIQPSGSWLYVWVDVADGQIAYVGGTGFDPELRAYLHLTSDNPEHGRVRGTVPDYRERDFDVLVFALPSDVSRAQAKSALIARLTRLGLITGDGAASDTLPAITEPIVDALEQHRSKLAADR